MCFSAPASFAASIGLISISGTELRIAKKDNRILAAIPFLFGIQQFFEGIQWLSLESEVLSNLASYGFLSFALLIWPVYIPFAVYTLDKERRSLMKIFTALGATLAAFFLFILLTQDISALLADKGIHYKIYIPFVEVITALYVFIVCGAPIFSSKAAFRWFGLIALIAGITSATFFYTAFVSVWCFLAAIISLLIYIYLIVNRREENKV